MSSEFQPLYAQGSLTVFRPSLIRGWQRLVLFLVVVLVSCWIAWLGLQAWRMRAFQAACENAREQEDWRTLRDVARRWVQWDPEAAGGWWRAAEAAQELDDLEDLVHCLGKIPESDPNVLLALVEKANLEWTALNRPLEALNTSETVLRLDPRVVEIQSRLISFYAMNLQRPLMLSAIRNAITAGAEPKEVYTYLVMADVLSFTNGAEINSRWLASAPDEERFKTGLAVHTAMKLAMSETTARTDEIVQLNKDALQQLNWFLDKQPDDPVLLTYLMHRAYLDGDLERVGVLLEQVGDQAADDHMVWVYRTWYHTLQGDFAQAEQTIQEALRLHPMSPLAHHEYANLLRKLQRPEVADQQRLAAYGRELRTQLMHLPTAADVTPALMLQIQSYASECGDNQVAASLEKRM